MDMLADPSVALFSVAGIFLLLFAVVAGFDGIYLHLWKLRLHTRSASYAEHLWHTASAVLFVPVMVLLFVVPSRGPSLWVAIALLAITHLVEVFDVRAERESRRDLGGLSRVELTLHVAAVATRSFAVLALLIARPEAIWFGGGTDALPPVLVLVGIGVTVGTVVLALVHVVLAVVWCPQCGTQAAIGGARS